MGTNSGRKHPDNSIVPLILYYAYVIPQPEHVSGAENGAGRNRVSGNGAVSGHSRKRLGWSGAWSRRPQSGAESGLNRPLKVRSHLT